MDRAAADAAAARARDPDAVIRVTIEVDRRDGKVTVTGPDLVEAMQFYDYTLEQVRRLILREWLKTQADAPGGSRVLQISPGGLLL